MLFEQPTELLRQLIATPSFSKEEGNTAEILQQFFAGNNIETNRHKNNIWAFNQYFDESKPTLMLNSHHDTVKPNNSYTKDPFTPITDNGKLYGLGSNDAGGPLVSLIATFLNFYSEENLTHNLCFVASAEEEISGDNGIASILDKIPKINAAIVGEPTQMRMAVAEKGLMVLECTATGRSSHAARNEGDNAIYKALDDIQWLRNYQFPNISDTLSPVKMTVTKVHAGMQHNVVPDECNFTVDIRSTDCYNNEEILKSIKQRIKSKINPRSIRLNPSFMPTDHPIIEAGSQLGLERYGSPTLSDQAFLSVPSLKIGPGKSARSHTANEFIYLNEIKDGIETYIKLLNLVIG